MHYCVTYDISNARLRRHMIKWCKQAGLRRVQRSVFAGPAPAHLMRELEQNVLTELPRTDRVCIFPLDAEALRRLLLLGDPAQQVLVRPKRRLCF